MESQLSYSSSSSTDYQQLSWKPKSKSPPHFHSSLHSVRRPLPAKPWKKPIAPFPPTPPRIYKVDSINFKQVVQKLTSAPEFQSRLQRAAPPPLSLSTTTTTKSNADDYDKAGLTLDLLCSPPNITSTPPLSATYRELMMSENLDLMPWNNKLSDSCAVGSPLGFIPSPTSHGWCSFPLLSPGTLSSMEQGTVL